MQDCLQTPPQRFGGRENLEPKIGQSPDRAGRDSSSPEVFAQPVTQCRSVTIHVSTGLNKHCADSSAVNLNAKFRCDLVA
jgi:hypothetical protein